MLFSLGGHLQTSSMPEALLGVGPEIRAHVRKLFWVVYALDKDLCFRSLRPPIINDDDCDMGLDLSPEEFLSEAPINSEIVSPFYPADIQLAILKGKIYRDLYSAKALRGSDAELLKAVRELDEELDIWKSELPVTYQPERSQVHEVSSHVTKNVRLLLLHLEYYQSLIMIHRASTRCSAWKDHKVPALQSSLDLCLEASRSTIHYLEASRQLPHGESFWYVQISNRKHWNLILNFNLVVK